MKGATDYEDQGDLKNPVNQDGTRYATLNSTGDTSSTGTATIAGAD
jgi:hypothetical protein